MFRTPYSMPTSSGKNVFVVIPAYNESKNIGQVIKDVKGRVDRIIVVDDCSRDETAAIARNNGADTLVHIINRGQGAALATGVEYALSQGADIIVHFDADGQFLASEIADVIAPILSGDADVVLGSRFMGKISQIPAFKRSVIMPLARLVNKIFLGIDLTDPQSGFRAFSRYAAAKINIEQDRMAHCTEILGKIYEEKLKVKEVPTSVIYHDFGQRLGGGIKIIKELFIGSLIK